MTGRKHRSFVLSVYPTSRGFSFVLFEGPATPYDWGSKEIRTAKKNDRTLEGIKKLVDRYEPEVLVYEAITSKSKRSDRVVRLYKMITHYAKTRNLTTKRYTRAEVRLCFSSVGAVTRYEIAQAIATQLPEFLRKLPPVRKLWQSEDARLSLFDAAAFGMTHYDFASHKERICAETKQLP